MPLCTSCGSIFEIAKEDLTFYSEMGPLVKGVRRSVPPPTHCFPCRVQRKLAFRNERHLYKRRCDLSGKEIFSIYSPNKPLKVYENTLWYGDGWDAFSYGREYDSSRSFFEQFYELLLAVPRPARVTFGPSENSEYCNHHLSYKDCYLCFWGDYNERCVCCYGSGRINSCLECKGTMDSSFCTYAINCLFCNNSAYIEECERVSDSRYLLNCRDCSHCFQCVNLRHKKYCIQNKEYGTLEAYQSALRDFIPTSIAHHTRALAEFEKFAAQFPRRATHLVRTENCRGNHLSNAKDCFDCYWLVFEDTEAARYTIASGSKVYKIYDCYGSGYNLTHCYDSFGLATGVNDCAFCAYVENGSSETFYSFNCHTVNHLFGCIGLRHTSHCVLNKKYTLHEYESLVGRIVNDMMARGEWGEFFPMKCSPFGYNESAAQDHYPLSQEEAKRKGAIWEEYQLPIASTSQAISGKDIPDRLEDIDETFLSTPILCPDSKRPFLLSRLELQLRREMKVPLSITHPDLRLGKLARSMGPYQLWRAICVHCGKECDSGYDPKSGVKILCEECYINDNATLR